MGRREGRSAAGAALAAVAVLVVAGVAGQARAGWREAAAAAEAALRARDGAALAAAIRELGAEQSVAAVKVLLQIAVAGRELGVHEALLQALGAQRGEAATYIREQVRAHRDWTVRYLLVEALERLPAEPPAHAALLEAIDDREPAVAGCAMAVAARLRLKDAIPRAIARLEEAERRPQGRERLREAALRALAELTGERLPDAASWRDWWKAKGAEFDPRAVARGGRDSEGGSHTVIRRIAERGEMEWIERLEQGDIYCVTGQFDSVQSVLAALGLPHTVIERGELAARIGEIPPSAVIIFNCHNHEEGIGTVAPQIRTLVERGAYLFTSDWELTNVILKALPGYLGQGNSTNAHEFPIQLAPGAGSHPYMRDVFPDNPYEAAAMRWHIDEMSYCIKPLRPQVVPLVVCRELGARYGSELVACTFRHGRGAVLHVLSHFQKQRDASGDGYALQQMLLNFIVEKQKFRAAGAGRGR